MSLQNHRTNEYFKKTFQNVTESPKTVQTNKNDDLTELEIGMNMKKGTEKVCYYISQTDKIKTYPNTSHRYLKSLS